MGAAAIIAPREGLESASCVTYTGSALSERSLRRSSVCICVILAVVLAACGRSPSPPPPVEDELIVALRPGPATWFTGTDDQAAGIDYDLLQAFAKIEKLKLKVVAASDPERVLREGNGVRIAAGGVYDPGAHAPSPADLLYSVGYYVTELVVIYNIDELKPKSWSELVGHSVGVAEGAPPAFAIAALRAAYPEIAWEAQAPSSDALIGQVSDGTLSYAVVDSNEADALRNVYLGFDQAFAAAGKHELVWAFPADQRMLRDAANAFFAKAKRDGMLARLIERNYARATVPRIDAGVFHERIKSLLPQYRATFERAQDASGIDWRLLAAIAYQESQWNASATSETGVRGLMQLTEDTAQRMGVVDRLDPQESTVAAARYLRELKDKLPGRIGEPDRTWIALAAYNIGVAHLEDARILAQKQKLDPDAWSAIRKTLPLLALPEYHEAAKYGYARGGMPIAFVNRVRAYYDILLAQQPESHPRLRMQSAPSSASIERATAVVSAPGGLP